jgi:hypothetical protein
MLSLGYCGGDGAVSRSGLVAKTFAHECRAQAHMLRLLIGVWLLAPR